MRDQPKQDLRGLRALVGILGVLIVLGTALVIGTVIHRLYARNLAPSMAPSMAPTMAPSMARSVAPAPAAPLAVPAQLSAAALAPGEHIAGIAGAGGALAIWVNSPAGDRILLFSPASGQFSVVLNTTR